MLSSDVDNYRCDRAERWRRFVVAVAIALCSVDGCHVNLGYPDAAAWEAGAVAGILDNGPLASSPVPARKP